MASKFDFAGRRTIFARGDIITQIPGGPIFGIHLTPLDGPGLHTRNPQYGAAVHTRAGKHDTASRKNASPASAGPQKAISNPFKANFADFC